MSSLRSPLVLALALAGAAGAAVAADRLTILNEGDTASLWRPVAETHAMPAYPGVVQDKSEDVCVGVGYLLKEDGSTSDFVMLTAWSSKAGDAKTSDPRFTPFAQNALAAVQRWRFESVAGATAKLKPVYTAASFAFSTSGADPVALAGRCRVADLQDFIARAQERAYRRGDLNKGRIDRSQVENPPVIQGRGSP